MTEETPWVDDEVFAESAKIIKGSATVAMNASSSATSSSPARNLAEGLERSARRRTTSAVSA